VKYLSTIKENLIQ